MFRKVMYALIGIVFIVLLVLAGLAQLSRNNIGDPDLRATQESSLTACADLYPAGSAEYKACVDSQ